MVGPEDMADEVAAQVLDEFACAPLADLERLCLRLEEWWVMGADAVPYVIRVWANRAAAGVIVRVRVDTHGWTRGEPALGAVLVETDRDRWLRPGV